MTTRDSTPSKSCCKCGVTKPLVEFPLNRRARDGRASRCKDCHRVDTLSCHHVGAGIRYARRRSARDDGYLSEDPSTWLRPGDRLMAGGFDWAWCYTWFKEIPGFIGYAAATNGTIWSRRQCSGRGIPDKWKVMQGHRRSDGYIELGLTRNGEFVSCRAHRLILETFVGPCPPGMEARHVIDNDRANNRLNNLRWGTPEENAEDKRRHGTLARGERIGCAKLTSAAIAEMYDMFEAGKFIREIAERFGMSTGFTGKILKGHYWRDAVPGRNPPLTGSGKQRGAIMREQRRRTG